MDHIANIRPIWLEVTMIEHDQNGEILQRGREVRTVGGSINVRGVMNVTDVNSVIGPWEVSIILIPGGQYVVVGGRKSILAQIDAAFDDADEALLKKARGF